MNFFLKRQSLIIKRVFKCRSKVLHCIPLRIRNFIFAKYCYFRKILGLSYTWLIYLITIVVIMNELLIYLTYIWYWPEKTCGDMKNFYTILLVADPHILGEKDEFWIARWDADRFLRNTFGAALRYTQPDVIVFLGDLMDEGWIADSQQFSRYLSRFKWIFDRHGANKTVFIPGDKDIDATDEVAWVTNIERFEQTFCNSSDLEKYEKLNFYKVNKMLRNVPELDGELAANDSTVRIVLSHIPILQYGGVTSLEAVLNLSPHLIFSGHAHQLFHFEGNYEEGKYSMMIDEIEIGDNQVSPWVFQKGKLITKETTVPTCSYRLGTQKIGYGLALIDKNGVHSCYMTLWLPQRLHQLFIYLILFILISIYLIVTNYSRLPTTLSNC